MLQKKGGGAAPLEFNVLYVPVSLGKESVMEKVGVQGLPELPVHVYFKALHIILTSCNNTPQKLLTIHKLSASQ